MKNLLTTLLILISTQFAFATEQLEDKLVIGKDTFCLKSFPLEKLNFKISPFMYGKYSFKSTGCWRGYQATWEISNGALYLVQIIKFDSTRHKLNLIEYFSINNYTAKIVNGRILADWYTATLQNYYNGYQKGCIVERDEFSSRRRKKLEFVKGEIVFNKLIN